jgi:hypothetical protein
LRKKAKAISNAARITKTLAPIPAIAPTERPLELPEFGAEVGVALALALAEMAGSKISLETLRKYTLGIKDRSVRRARGR